MEKVILPREVADAIEHCRKQDYSDRVIMRIHLENDGFPEKGEHQRSLQTIETGVLMQAIVNGYEVEQTPEEAVKQFYKSYSDEPTPHARGICLGINGTLDLLNIKISGVNE